MTALHMDKHGRIMCDIHKDQNTHPASDWIALEPPDDLDGWRRDCDGVTWEPGECEVCR